MNLDAIAARIDRTREQIGVVQRIAATTGLDPRLVHNDDGFIEVCWLALPVGEPVQRFDAAMYTPEVQILTTVGDSIETVAYLQELGGANVDPAELAAVFGRAADVLATVSAAHP